eukprot:265431_1
MSTNESDDLRTLKITLTILIFLFAICGVLTPRLFNPFGSKISYANLLSCGVIIAAALVHLLSAASIGLMSSPLPKASGDEPYPWSYFFCGLSFISLFFFERLLIHHFLHQKHHHHHHKNHLHHHQHHQHHQQLDFHKIRSSKTKREYISVDQET